MKEHLAVRNGVGVFDVSHMGDIRISGPQSLAAVQHITMNDAAGMGIGQCRYSAMLYPQGTFVDDVIVHRMGEDDYMLVINAGTREKDVNWVTENTRQFDCKVENLSDNYTQIAIQGPKGVDTLQKLTDADLSKVKFYWFTHGTVCGLPNILIARTGYTAEDGFEIYVPTDEATSARVWNEVMEAGKEFGIVPCGLGARNTLRLEGRLPLYGHEISDTINVWEAGLERFLKMEKGDFVGRDRAGARQGRRHQAHAGRAGVGGPRHSPRRLQGARSERQRDRLRHQRFVRAVSEEEHCAGLRADRALRDRQRSGGGNPQPAGEVQSGSDAVLQASEEAVLIETGEPVRISELLLPEFDAEIKNTRITLERVPVDKPDFAPHPKSMPLGKLAPHVAQLPGFGLIILTTPELDFATGSIKAATMESAAQLVSLLDEGAAKTRRHLPACAMMRGTTTGSFRSEDKKIFEGSRFLSYREMFLNHLVHHRAQLGVYLRMNDAEGSGDLWSFGG